MFLSLSQKQKDKRGEVRRKKRYFMRMIDDLPERNKSRIWTGVALVMRGPLDS